VPFFLGTTGVETRAFLYTNRETALID